MAADAVDVTLSPERADLGRLRIGVPQTVELTVTNTGSVDAILGGLGASYSDLAGSRRGGGFEIGEVSGTCANIDSGAVRLAPGQSCSYVVVLTPVLRGPVTLQFDLTAYDVVVGGETSYSHWDALIVGSPPR